MVNDMYQFQDSLVYSRASWVTESIIAWNVDVENGCCYLFASKGATLSFTDDGIQGLDSAESCVPIMVVEFIILMWQKGFCANRRGCEN